LETKNRETIIAVIFNKQDKKLIKKVAKMDATTEAERVLAVIEENRKYHL